MHEMSYMIKFINMAEEAAHATDEERIDSLKVRVGEMTGVLPEFLEKYFPDASKGTKCEGALFEVEFVPVLVKCRDCDHCYHPAKENGYCCPDCRSKEAEYLQGRELELSEVTVS